MGEAAHAVDPSTGQVAGPPRWILTQQLGVRSDLAPQPRVARPEPAIVGGTRVLVDAGVVVGAVAERERLVGFRSIPSRIGKGFVFWSDERIYRADAFLGPIEPIADLDAAGGVRPWLGGVLVRSERGLFVVDPTPGAHPVHRLDVPGLVDGAAFDGEHAVRLDLVGRASVTIDGGMTWTDLLATRGFMATELTEAEDGIWLQSSIKPLELDAGGRLIDPDDAPSSRGRSERLGKRRVAPGPPEPPAAATLLAPEDVAHAVIAGAPLPGGRALVAREGGLRIVATSSARVLRDVDIGPIEERYRHCQPHRDGAHVLLACNSDQGASMMVLSDAFGDAQLEATFGGSGAFLGGPRGRLAFVGGCGAARIGGSSEPIPEAHEGAALPEPLRRPASGSSSASESAATPRAPADARLCVRLHSGAWLERRLVGDDARQLYRWVVGDGGDVTALVFTDPAGGRRSGLAPREGVRVIRIDPEERGLAGARFIAPPAPMRDAPYRVVDDDFWQDDRGAIRGWVEVAGKAEAAEPKRSSPRAPILGRGARVAGVRIDPSGKASVLPLPAGTDAVVRGGRYAIATGETAGKRVYSETTDGGETWRPIDPPPVGDLDASAAANGFSGCSWMGCTWAGIVRLGWGGASAPRSEPAPSPPRSGQLVRSPGPPALTCRLRGQATAMRRSAGSDDKPTVRTPGPREPASESSPMISVFSRASETLGVARSGVWSAEVLVPFDPTAAPRRITVRDPALTGHFGSIAPLIGARDVELAMFFGEQMLRLDGAPKPRRFEYTGPFSALVDADRGDALALDAGRGAVVLARGDVARPVVRIVRTPDVARTRLAFARRIDAPGQALVALSTASGSVVAGDLDLGRGVVGRFASLGTLATLEDAGGCAAEERAAKGAQKSGPVYRFIAELPLAFALTDSAGAPIESHPSTSALVLVRAAGGRLCVEGVETELPERDGELVAAFSSAPVAAVRRPTGQRLDATCALEPRR